MSYLATNRLRIEKDVITRITRALRGKGTLSVSIGQEVIPEEIIGSAEIASGFRTLDLAAALSVSPQEVRKYLARDLGQRIYKDELLALKKGGLFMGKKVVVAPTDGVIDFVNDKTGELKISFLPKKVNLLSGVYGVIEKIDKDRGQVVIKTQASRVHGVFGSGSLRDGILRILGKRGDLVTKGAIQSKYADHILIGGSLFFKDTISSAISTGVSGIVTGGLNADDYKGMSGGRLAFPKKLDNDIGISVVACEGFGSIPLGPDIFSFLSEYEGRFVFIDGNKALISLPSFSSSCLVKVKSTALPMQQAMAEEMNRTKGISELKVGSNVRIVGNSYLGEQGVILSVDSSSTLLPSGIRTYIATIETSGRKIQVPVANLEIIR